MGVRFFSSTVGLGLLLATVPSYATAQEAAAALIDQDLSAQIDFRSLAFGLCFSQPTCTVEGVTITAERRDVAGDGWVPALIYWDPMDGLGVLEGGQNECEIARILVDLLPPLLTFAVQLFQARHRALHQRHDDRRHNKPIHHPTRVKAALSAV